MTARRTVCPFCRNGCESAVAFDGYQYRMEYVTDGQVNKGRLCPRGNSASIVVDHPRRLAYPLLDGRETDWRHAVRLTKDWLADVEPEALALVYGRGRSGEEVRLLWGLAELLGTRNLVCGHIEPENNYFHRLAGSKDATLDQVRSANVTLLVGDVFGTSPVAAGPILEARYADRKNRLVVVDSIKTRQAGFAHEFVQVRPGAEAFALMAIAALVDRSLKGVDIEKCAGLAGVDRKQLEQVAGMLSVREPGFVGSAMHLGRVRFAKLHSLASQLVAVKAEKPFIGFGEARVPPGPVGFGDLRKAIGSGRVRMLVWFGALHPYSYPELLPELDKVPYRVATSIFRPDKALGGLVLPVVSELERESTSHSYWGEVNRFPVASVFSGARSVPWIVGQLAGAVPAAEKTVEPISPDVALKMVSAAADLVPAEQPEWLLVGEKKAIGIGGFFGLEEQVGINPADARRLDAADGSLIRLDTATSSREMRAIVTAAVPQGVLRVGVNAHKNRALFPIDTESIDDEVLIPPVEVEVEKLAAARPTTEVRAVEF